MVVVGGNAAGMSAAAQARRRRDDLEIVALEAGPWVSYSSCGIPYLVAGDVDRPERLIARTVAEHRDRFRIDVRTGHRVEAVDPDRASVEVLDTGRNRTYRLGWDRLVMATGARPRRPDIPGADLETVVGVQTLADGERLLASARELGCRNAVVVGSGYVGLEMAEALVRWGARVTVVERAPVAMARALDPSMGRLVVGAMERFGIEVRCGVTVTAVEPGVVHTDAGPVPADLVVLGTGVSPDAALAADAGLRLGTSGAVAVDDRQRTSAEGIWAAGDCAEVFHLLLRRRVHVALGTVANRTGRVAGVNAAGGYARFTGVVGTAITRICSTEIARTGLSASECQQEGIAHRVVEITSTTRAGYWPTSPAMTVRMIAEEGTDRLLGVQIVGGDGAAKRIDTAATALAAGMRVPELIDLDLAYAPPFSTVWDPIQVAARALSGR